MQKTLAIKPPIWLLALALVAAGVSIYLQLNIGFQYFFLVPVLLFVLLFFVLKLDKFSSLLAGAAPLSVNINDIGAGLGMSFPTEPLIILTFVALLYYFIRHFKVPLAIIRNPLVLWIIAYTLWLWFSTVFSVQPLVSLKYALARSWYIVVFFFGGLLWFQKQANIRLFLIAQVVFTIILSCYTLVMHAQWRFDRGASYGISWPFFPDHGMYAACLAFSVPILIILIFNANRFGINNFWRAVFIGFLFILLFAIVVSYTRATWLSLVIALGVYLLLNFKVKFKYIFGLILLVAAIGIAKQDQILYSLEANKQGSSDELEGHVKSVSNITTDPSNLERINRWSCATRMAQDKPFTGFGPGTFVFQYGAYQKTNELTLISTFFGDLGDAHSEYFSALAEMGYLGLLLWGGLFIYSVAYAFRLYYNSSGLQRNTVLLSLLALITYYAHAFLNNYSQYDKIAAPLWSFLSILVIIDLQIKKQKTTA